MLRLVDHAQINLHRAVYKTELFGGKTETASETTPTLLASLALALLEKSLCLVQLASEIIVATRFKRGKQNNTTTKGLREIRYPRKPNA